MRYSLILCAALAPIAVQAAPATEAGAADIAAAIQQYLPPIPGVVSVRPEGETYVLSLDASPYFSMIPPGMGRGSLSTLEYVLTDQGGGLWGVTQSNAVDFSITIEGVLDMSLRVGEVSGTGVFDSALLAYQEITYTMEDLQLSQVMTDLNTGQVTRSSGSLASGVITGNSEAAGSAVNTYRSYNLSDYTVAGTQEGPFGEIAYSVTTPSGDGEIRALGLQSGDVLGLISWLFARPAPELILAEEDALRSMIRTALPLFESVEVTGGYEDLVVDVVGFGQVSVDRISVDADLNGVVSEGRFRERIGIEGLRLPEGILPPWAVAMIPADIGLNFELTGFDLAAPAALLLEQLDVVNGPDAALENALEAAILPTGKLTLSLLPDRIAGDGYHLDYGMSMQIAPEDGAIPTGAGRVSVAGFDRFLELANGAPEDIKGGMVPGLMMARGMSQAGDDDTIVWDVEFTPDQRLLVNGQDLSPLLGR